MIEWNDKGENMSKTEVTHVSQGQGAMIKSPFSAYALTEEQSNIIKTQIAPGITDGDLMYCLEIAKQAQLNPIIKEIYFVPRRSKIDNQWVTKHEPMIGRKGARSIARRKGMIVPPTTGYTLKQFPFLEDGEWKEKRDLIGWAELEITGQKVRKEAAYSVFVQKTSEGAVTKFWSTMPTVMIEKVAEFQLLDAVYGLDGLMYMDAGYIEDESSSTQEMSSLADLGKIEKELKSLNLEYHLVGDEIRIQDKGAFQFAAALKKEGFVYENSTKIWKIRVSMVENADIEAPKELPQPEPIDPKKELANAKKTLMKVFLGNGLTKEEAGEFAQTLDVSNTDSINKLLPGNGGHDELIAKINAFLTPQSSQTHQGELFGNNEDEGNAFE